MMKQLTRVMLGLLLGLTFCANIYAAEVTIDNKNLVDMLVQKGVLSKDEAKFVEKTNYERLSLGVVGFIDALGKDGKKTTAAGVSSTTAKETGVYVDRFYLQAIYHIDDTWYGRITMDVQNEQGNYGTSSSVKRNMNVFLKYAYIEGNFMPELQLRLGLSHTPWIDYEDGLWKHRYVSKSFIDNYGFDDSSDYGVGVKGKFLDSLLEYWITESNGGGYGKPNASKSTDLDSRLTFRPVSGLDISVQFRDGDRGTNTYSATSTTHSTLSQAFISYGQEDFRIGGNYVQNKKKVSTSSYSTKDSGYGLWGWYNFAQNYGVIGRYENLDTDNAVSAPTTQNANRYVMGLEYRANKNLSFSLAYDYTKKKNLNNVNGDSGEDTIYGLYTQFSF